MIRLDDLCVNGYKIYQDDTAFRFGTDAVLLAWFAGLKKFANAFDLCTGNGVIPILLSVHTCAKRIEGIDIDENAVKLAKKSTEYNKLEDILYFHTGDIKDIPTEKKLLQNYFDLVTANPPYMTKDSGAVCEGVKGKARTELFCNTNDVMNAAKYLLKNGGRLSIINKPDRLTDTLYSMRENGLEPKRLLFVCPRINSKPELMLVEAIKGGKAGIDCMAPLIIYGDDGQYTDELKKIYGK